MLRTLGGAAIDFETIDVPAGGASLDAAKARACRRALCTVDSGSLRLRLDGGDPTSSAGHKLDAGGSLLIERRDQALKASFRRIGPSTCTMQVTYLR